MGPGGVRRGGGGTDDAFEDLAGGAHLGEVRDHGEEDAHRAGGGGAEDGGELGLEKVGPAEEEADAAHAERGVGLGGAGLDAVFT